jgi:hypothetical protein
MTRCVIMCQDREAASSLFQQSRDATHRARSTQKSSASLDPYGGQPLGTRLRETGDRRGQELKAVMPTDTRTPSHTRGVSHPKVTQGHPPPSGRRSACRTQSNPLLARPSNAGSAHAHLYIDAPSEAWSGVPTTPR